MTKGWVSQIMRKADRFGQVFVTPQTARERPPHLGNLHTVGKPVAIVIPFGIDKDLGLIFQAAESRGVDDAVAVTLVGSTIGMLILWVGAPATFVIALGIRYKIFV